MGKKSGIVVACGRLRIDWSIIAAPMHWIRTTDLEKVLHTRYTSLSEHLLMLDDVITLSWTLGNNERPVTLEYLLSVSSELQATDPRDKIIALLGLVSPTDPSLAGIKIDYGQPVADFFRDVTGAIMTSNNSLRLLSLRGGKSSHPIPERPSWVPDYSLATNPKYRSINLFNHDQKVDIEWAFGSNIISFNGHFIDEIESLPNYSLGEGGTALEGLSSWLNIIAKRFVSIHGS